LLEAHIGSIFCAAFMTFCSILIRCAWHQCDEIRLAKHHGGGAGNWAASTILRLISEKQSHCLSFARLRPPYERGQRRAYKPSAMCSARVQKLEKSIHETAPMSARLLRVALAFFASQKAANEENIGPQSLTEYMIWVIGAPLRRFQALLLALLHQGSSRSSIYCKILPSKS